MALDTIPRPQSTGKNGGDMSAYKYCRSRDGFVHLDVIVDGKRFRRSTGRPDTPANLKYVDKNWQSEVDRILKKGQAEVIEEGEITVEKYGYKSLHANRIDRKDTTNTDYRQGFEKHIIPIFGNIPISKVKQSDLKAWQTYLKEEKKLSGKRIHAISTVFQGIMRDAVNDELITKSPFYGMKGVSRAAMKEITPFTFDEVRYILSNAEGWFKNWLAVAFFTGMRTGEINALSWEDISIHSGKIIVRKTMTRGVMSTTKTGTIREIDMLPPVLEALKEQFKITGLKGESVFYSRWTQEAFTNTSTLGRYHFKPLLKRLLLGDRNIYQTRHTFATMMISKGEDITWVSKMLGHSNPAITLSVYTKYREDQSVKRASFLDQVDVFKSADKSRECHVSVTQSDSDKLLKIS
ncbi:tyrosine-type recombinase/integrase [Sulfuricurvum sp.]|uniref:tyrosine-type recombinase/integrase n=1 Tax=Sulfuricurvum sp. TaxID=2025608 RepID=UPI0026333E2B|nr:tyrosine-type recombinase/integrase [Sulfuricurvum sp.]MDD2267227.1 tyrosine-type recombinase/integrase [Sulfuricurvum sp.]MDD2782851.1 tyrosine-type recombinase/integrase [Sulfuricurvum sp.]